MLKISEISFPGFGIDTFEVQSEAFNIPIGSGVSIAWYAIIITLGMIGAIIYTVYRAKQIGVTVDDVIDFAIPTILIGVIGARLYYVLTKLEEYKTFADFINIRNGGLAIYGGIIGGAISVFFVCYFKKIRFTAFADCCTPGIILAQSIGRWGNFMNGEAFGYETDIFCRMGLNNNLTGYQTIFVHPTFLYESVWNLVGFILINLFYKHRKYDGQILLLVFGWYGLGRMFIEGLRTDSLYTTIFAWTFRTSQVLAAVILVVCVGFLVYFAFKKPYDSFYFKPIGKKEKEGK